MVKGFQIGPHGMYDGQATGEAFPNDLYPPGHKKGKGQGNPTKNGKQPIPAVAFYDPVKLFKLGEHGLRGFRTQGSETKAKRYRIRRNRKKESS